MSKLRSNTAPARSTWVQLKTNIEESISTDIDLMCQWSDNERRYVVNELLRYALSQSEEFQKYKAGRQAKAIGSESDAKPVQPPIKPASDPAPKPHTLPSVPAAKQ